jgi:hypothetical protein
LFRSGISLFHRDLSRLDDGFLALRFGVVPGLVPVRRQSVHIDRIRRLHRPVKGKATQIIRDHAAIVAALPMATPTKRSRRCADIYRLR